MNIEPKGITFSHDVKILGVEDNGEEDVELVGRTLTFEEERLPKISMDDDDTVDYESRRNIFQRGGSMKSIKGGQTMLDLEFASMYQPYVKKDTMEDRVVLRREEESGDFCSKIGAACGEIGERIKGCISTSSIEDELDEPPKRYIYLGKQKPDPDNGFEGHEKNASGSRLARPPRKQGESETVFATNYLSTMKYQPFFMFPIQNLIEQLSRTANFYFLCILIISLPFIQFGPKPYSMVLLPLVLVLGLNAAKEAVEDFNRWKLDTLDNNSLVDVWDGKQFIPIPWKEVRVGDLLRITQDANRIPADILILQSSSAKGLCNIETSNLDGETNLKQKQAVGETYLLHYSEEDGADYPINLTIEVESEAPNELMGSKSWKGNVKVNDGAKCALGMNQLILRGCSLKNTDWIIAMAIFTGMETKLMLNNKAAELKRSHLDVDVDRFIKFVFLIMLGFSLFGVAYFAIWNEMKPDDYWYIYIASDGFTTEAASGAKQFYRFFMWIGNYEILIPMTLLVTVELCKLVQTSFINYDKDMRYLDEEELALLKKGQQDTEEMGIWAVCRTSSLNDELGQIGWVFSDKTGTLTRNVMEFQNCYTCADSVSVWAEGVLASPASDKENMIKTRDIEFAVGKYLELDAVTGAVGVKFVDDTKFRVYIPCLRGKDLTERQNEAKQIKKSLQKIPHEGLKTPTGAIIAKLTPKINHHRGKIYGPGYSLKHNEIFGRMSTDSRMPEYSEKECHFEDNRLAWEATIDCHADNFLTCLAVCHNVIPDYPETAEEIVPIMEGGKQSVMRTKTVTSYSHERDCVVSPPKYQASSPDEQAFVIFCKNLQYYFHDVDVERIDVGDVGIDGTRAVVRIRGEDVIFDILDVIEFTSHRKRMSVICRDPRDGLIKCFTKGADNIILERLTEESKYKHWADCEKALKEFATQGLRTLCLAIKELTQEEYVEWHKEMEAAKSDLERKEELLTVVYAKMECELTLLGATAIEDRLQDGVPETIMNLHAAGMNVWVLTGDKVETAINIGRSCRLITDEMHNKNGSTTLIVIDIDEMLEADVARKETKEALDKALAAVENNTPEEKHNQGLVLSGKALGFVFPIRKRDKFGKEIPPTKEEAAEEKVAQEQLLKICVNCSAVLCCRVSPKQKAQMVDLVKKNIEGSITLSIGDGANDVPMIKSAHVGVGIRGHEGIQAVMASDYAIGQFRYLNTLLFIHGAWNFRRSGTVILYIFYKSAVLILLQLWFGFYSAFSATNYIEPLAQMMFNTIYTQFPVMVLGMFDKPYPKDIALLCPKLYSERGCYKFTNTQFFATILEATIQSLIIFYITCLSLDSQPNEDGHVFYMWNTSYTAYSAILMVVTFKVAILFRSWIKWTIYTLVLGPVAHIAVSLWWTSTYIEKAPPISPFPNWRFVGAFSDLIGDGRFWMVSLISVGVTFVPVMLIDYAKRVMFGCREHCIQEMIRDDPKVFEDFKTQLRKGQKEFFEREVQIKEENTNNGYQDFAIEGDLVGQKDARIARLVTRKTMGFVKAAEAMGDADQKRFKGAVLGSAFNLGLESIASNRNPSYKRMDEPEPNDTAAIFDGPRISFVSSAPSARRTSMLENRLKLPGNALSTPTQQGGFSVKFKAIGTMSFLTDLTDSEDEEMSAFDENYGKTRVNAAKSAPLPPAPDFETPQENPRV